MGLSSLHIQYCSPRGRGLDLFRNPECWRGRGGVVGGLLPAARVLVMTTRSLRLCSGPGMSVTRS